MTGNVFMGCGECGHEKGICQQMGCRKFRHINLGWPSASRGCVCPPTSEQTCQNPNCPRKPPAPLTVTCSTGATP